jgi:hypothetical protein
MTIPKIYHGAVEGAEFRRVLLVAPPKAGKTHTTAATACKDPKKLLMVMADEGGQDTLKAMGYKGDHAYLTGNNPYQDSIDFAAHLRTKNPFPYDVLCIDSASMLQTRIKTEIEEKEKAQLVTAAGKYNTQRLYGMLLDRFRQVVLAFHRLPCHIVWTAWLREPMPTRMGGALLQGQGADILEGNVGGIIVLELAKGANGETRRFRTKPFYLGASKEVGLEGGLVNAQQRFGLPDPCEPDVGAILHHKIVPGSSTAAAAPEKAKTAPVVKSVAAKPPYKIVSNNTKK